MATSASGAAARTARSAVTSGGYVVRRIVSAKEEPYRACTGCRARASRGRRCRSCWSSTSFRFDGQFGPPDLRVPGRARGRDGQDELRPLVARCPAAGQGVGEVHVQGAPAGPASCGPGSTGIGIPPTLRPRAMSGSLNHTRPRRWSPSRSPCATHVRRHRRAIGGDRRPEPGAIPQRGEFISGGGRNRASTGRRRTPEHRRGRPPRRPRAREGRGRPAPQRRPRTTFWPARERFFRIRVGVHDLAGIDLGTPHRLLADLEVEIEILEFRAGLGFSRATRRTAVIAGSPPVAVRYRCRV